MRAKCCSANEYISAGLIKPWSFAVYFTLFISNRSKRRVKEEIDYARWKNHRTLKNDRYRCVRRGIGDRYDARARGDFAATTILKFVSHPLAHPSTPSTPPPPAPAPPLSSFYRRRPSPGIYLFPRGSYAARCLVSRLSGTSEQRDGEREPSGGSKRAARDLRGAGGGRGRGGREFARGETPRVVTR